MQVFTQNAGCMLKHGPTFLAATWSGDVDARTTPEHGLYQEDTRFLSRLVLQLNQQAPLLLQATVSHDSRCLTTHLTNPQLLLESGHVLPKRTIHLVRTSLLWEHVLYQQLVITSCSAEPCLVALTLSLDADFADVFEIQGYARSADGRREIAHGPDGQLGFRYTGADALERRATVGFTSRPAWLDETTASMVLTLQPQQSRICGWSVALSSMLAEPAVWSFAQADQRHRAAITHADLHATINTSQTLLQHWLDQSIADIEMLLTRREHIWYPDAGLPWCRAPAGRDGIFTALALLWYRPEIARGVLTYLAATQATTYDSRRGAEPGKILTVHHSGEMATAGDVALAHSYHAVETTPLFVLLAGRYLERTDDQRLLRALWPHIEQALHWMDTVGDCDGDGLVEDWWDTTADAACHEHWRSVGPTIRHADGQPAQGRLARCEVQGYGYAARRAAATVAQVLGHTARAEALLVQANDLREQVDRLFWLEDLGTYALALDGAKRACAISGAAAGLALFSGIAYAERAEQLAQTLLQPDLASGWGIRTLSTDAPRYNPLAAYNGAVWPHHTLLIASGLHRYGYRQRAFKLLRGLFEMVQTTPRHRLPEQVCGFERQPGLPPVPFYGSCAPQASASAVVFGMIELLLGLTIDMNPPRIRLQQPVLPSYLPDLQIEHLAVGDQRASLSLWRSSDDGCIHVSGETGHIALVLEE